MFGKQMHNILKDIVRVALKPEYYKLIEPFYISFVPKELRSKHGHIKYGSRPIVIEVFNLARPPLQMIRTAIHEVAHLVELSIYGETGHSPRFYKVYKLLAEAAVKMGILTLADFNVTNSADGKKLYKLLDPNLEYDPKYDIYKDDIIISVDVDYSKSLIMNGMGYSWNKLLKKMEKEIKRDKLQDECRKLNNFVDVNSCVSARAKDALKIEPIYYVYMKSEDTYDAKDILSDNGYVWRGFGIKKKVWVKEIKAVHITNEMQLAHDLGFELKVWTR
jgi:hypothetical protein